MSEASASFFSPFQAHGYSTVIPRVLLLAEGLGTPCRSQHCTDSINTLHIDSTLVVRHHLVYLYGVHNVYIQFMSIKSLRLNICKSLPCLVLLPRQACLMSTSLVYSYNTFSHHLSPRFPQFCLHLRSKCLVLVSALLTWGKRAPLIKSLQFSPCTTCLWQKQNTSSPEHLQRGSTWQAQGAAPAMQLWPICTAQLTPAEIASGPR